MDQQSPMQIAWSMARKYHGAQMYGELPYLFHISKVFRVLKDFGVKDNDILIASILHDVPEDTNCTIEEIKTVFGDRIADIVNRVTNEEGKNRKERAEKTYPKIREIQESLMVKLADRIANTEESLDRNPDLFKMYKKEYTSFRLALHTGAEGIISHMWDRLDWLMGLHSPPPSLL